MLLAKHRGIDIFVNEDDGRFAAHIPGVGDVHDRSLPRVRDLIEKADLYIGVAQLDMQYGGMRPLSLSRTAITKMAESGELDCYIIETEGVHLRFREMVRYQADEREKLDQRQREERRMFLDAIPRLTIERAEELFARVRKEREGVTT